MTRDECLVIFTKCAAWWPHRPLPQIAVDGWLDLLSDVPAHLVDEAVKGFAAAGKAFPPAPGEILNVFTRKADDWGDVLGEIREKTRQMNRDKRFTGSPVGVVWQTPAVDEWSDRNIAELIRKSGGIGTWMQKAGAHIWSHAEDDTTFLAQQREIWKGMKARADRQGQLEAAGATELLQIESTDRPQSIGELVAGIAEVEASSAT
ncbi:MAG: replicative helicase loader/inhibitor [Bradyrhizobium sp.]